MTSQLTSEKTHCIQETPTEFYEGIETFTNLCKKHNIESIKSFLYQHRNYLKTYFTNEMKEPPGIYAEKWCDEMHQIFNEIKGLNYLIDNFEEHEKLLDSIQAAFQTTKYEP